MGGNHATHPEPFTELAWPKGEVPGWRDGYETGDGQVTTTCRIRKADRCTLCVVITQRIGYRCQPSFAKKGSG